MGRPEKAGELKGKSIVEDVHLFYQNNTALRYLESLKEVIDTEYFRRLREKVMLRDGKP